MITNAKFSRFIKSDRLISFVILVCFWLFNPGQSFALNQAQITAEMGAGWNLGNQLEANSNGIPREDAWNNSKVTKDLLTLVKSAGFKSIRIPVSYLNKIGAAPDYTIDPVWLARIKEVVDYCIDQNLYAIINIHGDGYNDIAGSWLLVKSNNQSAIKDKFGKVWTQIANTFKDYDEHLIFESMNEVFDGNYYDPDPALYANLNAYNQVFIDAVRKTGGNNASRWLLIPGWNTNHDYTVNDYGFVLPTDTYRASSIPASEKRIMISVHYYTPWEFCGDQSDKYTQWGKIATDTTKSLSWANEPYLETQLNLLHYKFIAQGYPVIVGEWGSIDKSRADPASNTYREHFAKTLCSYCKQYGAIPVYWDNGYNGDYGFALFDRPKLTVTEQGIIDAIKSGMTNTAAPGPAIAPAPLTPVPTGPGAKISVLYKCGAAGDTSGSIRFSIQVQNDDVVDVPLENVTIRYWYVRDDGKWQSFNCFYAVLGSTNITGSMVRIPLSSAVNTSDFYAEIGFKTGTGTLKPGANSGEIQITLSKYDNSQYNQKNDYSFNQTMADFAKNMKITAYVNGTLVFGNDPFGSVTATLQEPVSKIFKGDGPVIKNLRKNGNVVSLDIMLSKAEKIGVTAYNLSGKNIATIADRLIPAGTHSLIWNTAAVPTGCYIIELRAGKSCVKRRYTVSH